MDISDVSAWEGTYAVTVSARTLTSVLAEAQIDEIDLLTLDVEGFELEVLDGLDFDRFAPRYLLVEANGSESQLAALLGTKYDFVAWLSPGDVLYRRRHQIQRCGVCTANAPG